MRAIAAFLLMASPVVGQGTVGTISPEEDPGGFVETIEPDPNVIVSPLTGEVIELEEVAQPPQRAQVETGSGAVLRWLDKTSGVSRDVEMASGDVRTLGRLEVELGECRFPPSNTTGEAFAWLDIKTAGRDETEFSGWMMASSPALSALDHPRYDVWVIRCTTT